MGTEAKKGKKSWLPGALVVLALLVLFAGGGWWLSHLKGGAGPKRQVARIALLPDTPPPPPPKEEKKPEPPKQEPKQPVPQEQPKQVEAPKAPEPIKMEGAAGQGSSAFAAGGVNHEYQGGPAVSGGTGGSGTGSDRAQERFFANTARQQLHDEIERRLKGEDAQLIAVFAIWVAKDGAIERYELTPSDNPHNDAALRAALDETMHEFKLPPPPALTQPLRFKLSVRPQA
ncbi:MAG: TonB C-terminal domain-containing protein [Pelomonas sp.]|nr:TonB C-terminal domain-containing protein [Roseateles sp.]